MKILIFLSFDSFYFPCMWRCSNIFFHIKKKITLVEHILMRKLSIARVFEAKNLIKNEFIMGAYVIKISLQLCVSWWRTIEQNKSSFNMINNNLHFFLFLLVFPSLLRWFFCLLFNVCEQSQAMKIFFTYSSSSMCHIVIKLGWQIMRIFFLQQT